MDKEPETLNVRQIDQKLKSFLIKLGFNVRDPYSTVASLAPENLALLMNAKEDFTQAELDYIRREVGKLFE